jgi:FAD/FMN-containing dehydrogenase
MSSSAPSWGRYPRVHETTLRLHWRDELPGLASLDRNVLACGKRRSYGDSAVNDGGYVADLSPLDRLVAFDSLSGRLTCEAGVTIGELLAVGLPSGWIVPAIPGTKFVTVGGAIANDVHGKNHAICGSFGCSVERLVLWRSRDGFVECSAEHAPGLFTATMGGLGLTGAIVQAELRLRRHDAPRMDVEVIPFGSVPEFLTLAAQADPDWEYTVAWVDTLARRPGLGRGVFFRANPGPAEAHETVLPKPRWSLPFDLPEVLLQRAGVRAFNALYRATHGRARQRVPLESFFFPLDAIDAWNRIYGRSGFLQHQSVVPMPAAEPALTEMLRTVAESDEVGFLSVLKTFGDVRSPGMLSFPRPGATLAVDFPMRGPTTLALLERLDAIVRSAGGAVYPAKDARMSPATFRASFPRLEEFRPYVDPLFSSSFWRRVSAA